MRGRLIATGVVAALGACGGDDGGSPVDAELGMHTLTGVVRYEDRPQLPNGRLGPIRPQPARAVPISLLAEDDGEVLASGLTGDDGSFTLEYSRAVPAEPSHLLVATVGSTPERPIEVRNRAGQVHGFGSPTFGNEALTQDVLVTDASGASEAFNIYDQLVVNADAIRTGLGVNPAMLVAIWERGNTSGTNYSGQTMRLLGTSDDNDGYDDTVILHEAGHFVEHTIGRSNNPGGFHDGGPDDPRLAWSEGFSTYWAMAVLGAPFYGDSNSGGGWFFNGDTSITRTPQPTGPMDQDVAEGMITEILWDMADTGGDDDTLAGDPLAVNRVQPMYLRNATLRSVGHAGVDLVDFLDGWFLADGLSHCAAVRSIVTITRNFPYVYAGPGGACP